MHKHIDRVANGVKRHGPLLATLASLALAIVVAACGPGNGGGSGY